MDTKMPLNKIVKYCEFERAFSYGPVCNLWEAMIINLRDYKTAKKAIDFIEDSPDCNSEPEVIKLKDMLQEFVNDPVTLKPKTMPTNNKIYETYSAHYEDNEARKALRTKYSYFEDDEGVYAVEEFIMKVAINEEFVIDVAICENTEDREALKAARVCLHMVFLWIDDWFSHSGRHTVKRQLNTEKSFYFAACSDSSSDYSTVIDRRRAVLTKLFVTLNHIFGDERLFNLELIRVDYREGEPQ